MKFYNKTAQLKKNLLANKQGFLLPMVIFLILGTAAVYPLLIDMSETTMTKTQYGEEWMRIHWAVEGANQKHQSNMPIDLGDDLFSNPTDVNFKYNGGDFGIDIFIGQASTLFERNKTFRATATAYRMINNTKVDAGYALADLDFGTFSVPGVTAGDYFSIAWGTDAVSYAWGENDKGQLGISHTTNTSSPTKIKKGDLEFADRDFFNQSWLFAAGSKHSMAVDYYGYTYTWGDNTKGQLATGNTISRYIPTQVAKNSVVVDIAAGKDFSLALTANNQVVAVGNNDRGQLGCDPPNTGIPGISTKYLTESSDPLAVAGLNGLGTTLNDIVGITAGDNHALAMDKHGQIYSWGDNNYGQLGSAYSQSLTRKPIKANDTIPTTMPGVPYYNTQSGPGTTQIYVPVPFLIASFTVTTTSQLSDPSLIVDKYDEIRLIHKDDSSVMVQIRTNALTCAETKKPYTWTYSSNNSTSNFVLPKPGTYTVQLWSYSNFLGIFGSLKQNNGIWYKNTQQGNKGVFSFRGCPAYEPTGIVGVAAGGDYSMAAAKDADNKHTLLYTWGRNDKYQLGHGNTNSYNQMALVATSSTFLPAPQEIRGLAAGKEHALLLTKCGKVYSWGNNTKGQLGHGNTTTQTTPKMIDYFNNNNIFITSIAAGAQHSLAVDKDAKVYSWGDNTKGQLGRSGSTNLPGVVILPDE